MNIDAECLLEAKVENVERLAVALGVRLPPHRGDGRAYARRLARAVLRGLEDDRRKGQVKRNWAALTSRVHLS